MRDAARLEEDTAEAERSTAAILLRSDQAADRIESLLRESEKLLERLRSGK